MFLIRLDDFLQLQSHLALFANAPGATEIIVPSLFGVAALLLMVLTPLFTMRLIAEERRNQTWALLLASPLSETQIVLGKFAGLLLFLWLVVLFCTLMPLVLEFGTPMDTGMLLANGLGLLLLTASYAALGLYVSALIVQPVVAAIGALAVLLGLWLADASSSGDFPLWHVLTPTGQFSWFNRGLISSNSMVYFLLFCVFFLLLTIRRVRSNRMYG
jgi:gliding motility-associated transport system permease protein